MIDLFAIKEELDSFMPTTSAREWQNFMSSSLWRDLQMELFAWLMERWEALEKEDNHVDAAVIRGNIETIRRLLGTPEHLRNVAEEAMSFDQGEE